MERSSNLEDQRQSFLGATTSTFLPKLDEIVAIRALNVVLEAKDRLLDCGLLVRRSLFRINLH